MLRLWSRYSYDDMSKHENYEVLNLIGYGLAKFNNDFINQFSYSTKSSFYRFIVEIGIADSVGTVKNRMDLFDHFFPNNGRKGWWQKGDAYLHRKLFIDSLFGTANVSEYAEIVKMYLQGNYGIENLSVKSKPITESKFRKLQETGLEAELFFMHNFRSIDIFKDGVIEDARLFGDGYDFQIESNDHLFLAEVKGIRQEKGKFRLTQKEFSKAQEYGKDYIITIVLSLNDSPYFLTIDNPLKNLNFQKKLVKTKDIIEYHLTSEIC